MRLPAPTLGALICSVILVNTGYLGLPMTVGDAAAISSLIVGQAYGLDQRPIATVIVWSTATVVLVGVATAAI
jgi:hypothetical protein